MQKLCLFIAYRNNFHSFFPLIGLYFTQKSGLSLVNCSLKLLQQSSVSDAVINFSWLGIDSSNQNYVSLCQTLGSVNFTCFIPLKCFKILNNDFFYFCVKSKIKRYSVESNNTKHFESLKINFISFRVFPYRDC